VLHAKDVRRRFLPREDHLRRGDRLARAWGWIDGQKRLGDETSWLQKCVRKVDETVRMLH
jgi:hypothetical protein